MQLYLFCGGSQGLPINIWPSTNVSGEVPPTGVIGLYFRESTLFVHVNICSLFLVQRSGLSPDCHLHQHDVECDCTDLRQQQRVCRRRS